MAQARVIDITDEELGSLLQSGVLAGHKLRLIVEPDEEDLTAGIPDPPFTVRSRDQLIALLNQDYDSLENGKGIAVTPEYWNDIRRELAGRAMRRGGQ